MVRRPSTTRTVVLSIALLLSLPTGLSGVLPGGSTAVSALPPPDTDIEADSHPSPTNRYVTLDPCRLADTRTNSGFRSIDDRTSRIGLDACGIPVDATAIVATTTVIKATGNGWLIAYPTGSPRPESATLNWSRGMTRGNSSVITVGSNFSVDLYRSDGASGGDLAIDVVGAFVPAETATSGRFKRADEALRLADTRESHPGTGTPIARPLTGGSTRRIALPESVPDDVDAITATFTVVDTSAATFVTAHPAGSARPLAAVLNADGPGQFRSASTVVPVTADGFDVYVSATTDLVIDMTGWFTGPDADPSTDGLFVPLAPTRLRDTRLEAEALYAGGTSEIELPPQLRTTSGSTPAALALSITLIGSDERGFVTAHAARAERPATASGYSLRNEITAQFAVAPVSETGLAIFSEQGTDFTLDVLGWFTGDSVIETDATAAPNPRRPLRVLAIGDSTMAGVRWYGALGALTGAEWTFTGESCRRLVRASCRGREGRYSQTAMEAIITAPDVFDVVMMMTGYNDRASTFESDLDQIMSAARSRSVRDVVWLTYARETGSDKGGVDATQVYEFHNAVLRAAGDRHHDLTVAEWSTVVRSQPQWVHYDGIHLSNDGAYGNADFMSRAVAHATGRPCSVPYAFGTEATEICADPGSTPPPDVRALYDFADTVTQCWEVGPTRAVECVQDPFTR